MSVAASRSRAAVRRARWWQWCGAGAILAALPSAIWRVLVGIGVPLGTPDSWRASQQLPGRGTVYVATLSVIQLVAALATLLLVVPGADRVPSRSPVASGRRFPTALVVSISLAGAVLLAALCVLSVLNWGRVDPFGDADELTGWSLVCWTSYAVTPAWPVLLMAATIGYAVDRHRARWDDAHPARRG